MTMVIERQTGVTHPLPAGYSTDNCRCCDERITVAFFNQHALWFTDRGKRVRVRLRELLNETPECDWIVAALEALGVQFELLPDGRLHFWVTGNRDFQLRYCYSRAKNFFACCSDIEFARVRRNRWSPSLSD